MSAAALLALADRVEALGGPDRGIDRSIAEVVGTVPVGYERACVRGVAKNYWWHSTDRDAPHFYPPAFTASLDAARGLAPSKWRLRQIQFSAPCADCRKWQCQLYGGREGEDYFTAFAATLELAFTAALLRALAQVLA
jgi:hypothetical protein